MVIPFVPSGEGFHSVEEQKSTGFKFFKYHRLHSSVDVSVNTCPVVIFNFAPELLDVTFAVFF